MGYDLNNLEILDTTMRDGMQRPGVVWTAQTKAEIANLLENYGVPFIECGMIANNKDRAYLNAAKKINNPRLVVFGRTRDDDVSEMEKSGFKAFTLVGKSDADQVKTILKKDPEAYLDDVTDYVERLSKIGTVFYDAEFFFPMWVKGDRKYALDTLKAAADGGASRLVLCDTTGIMNYRDVEDAINKVSETVDLEQLGVHFHNDKGKAVTCTQEAIYAGVPHVQTTVNGLGERCGNADLGELLGNLYEDDGYAWPKLGETTNLSRNISRLVGVHVPDNHPYYGKYAFSQNAGMHSSANLKRANTYRRVDPQIFGNKEVYTLTNQSGRDVIVAEANKYGFGLKKSDAVVKDILSEIQELNMAGDAQFLSILYKYVYGTEPFSVSSRHVDNVFVKQKEPSENDKLSTAQVWLVMDNDVLMGRGESSRGSVDAMDIAFRKVLEPLHPNLKKLELKSYEVNDIPGSGTGTSSVVRVDCDYSANGDKFTSITFDPDTNMANQRNLEDAYKYMIIKDRI